MPGSVSPTGIHRWFPGLATLRHYQRAWLA